MLRYMNGGLENRWVLGYRLDASPLHPERADSLQGVKGDQWSAASDKRLTGWLDALLSGVEGKQYSPSVTQRHLKIPAQSELFSAVSEVSVQAGQG